MAAKSSAADQRRVCFRMVRDDMETSDMLDRPMRFLVTTAAVLLLVVLALKISLAARKITAAEASEIAAVLAPIEAPGAPPAYAHCASCHLHDGSGRPDGSIPRLNGQRRAVIENKLLRLRAGMTRLPVMGPFARTLSPHEISEIAAYLSELPDTLAPPSEASVEERAAGASLYADRCASCHGAHGEGQDGLFASRLCGQYAGYLHRRLREVAARERGDADAVMQEILEGVAPDELDPIVKWLAAGNGCLSP